MFRLTSTTNYPRMFHIQANQKGQALVEVALSIFLLLLLVFGITEFGRAMYTKNTLTNAARAGVRQGVVTPSLPARTATQLSLGDTYTCPNTANPEQCVYKAVWNSLFAGIEPSDVYVTIDVKDVSGNPVSTAQTNYTVTVTAERRNYQSFVPKLIPINDTLSGEASMRQEQ